jgi:hypothetical protein
MQAMDVINSNKPMFSLRIVALDYYLAPPIQGLDVSFSSLEGTAVDLVPIVRVFGSTPAGQRVCLHLHQVRSLDCCCVPAVLLLLLSMHFLQRSCMAASGTPLKGLRVLL